MSLSDNLNKAKNNALSASEKYARATKDYYSLKIFQQFTRSLSYAAKIALIGAMLFIGVVLLFVAGVIYLGTILSSMWLSCVIMAGLAFILGYIIYLQRSKLDKLIIKKVAHEFFD